MLKKIREAGFLGLGLLGALLFSVVSISAANWLAFQPPRPGKSIVVEQLTGTVADYSADDVDEWSFQALAPDLELAALAERQSLADAYENGLPQIDLIGFDQTQSESTSLPDELFADSTLSTATLTSQPEISETAQREPTAIASQTGLATFTETQWVTLTFTTTPTWTAGATLTAVPSNTESPTATLSPSATPSAASAEGQVTPTATRTPTRPVPPTNSPPATLAPTDDPADLGEIG